MGPLWSGKIDLSNYKRRMHVRYGLRTNVRHKFESLGHHFLRHHFCWIFLFSCVVILHLISLTNLMISLRRKSREEIPHEKEFTSENIERDPPIPRYRQGRSTGLNLLISEISPWQKCFSELKISNPRISCTLNGVRRSS